MHFKAIWRDEIFYDSCIFSKMQTTVISKHNSKQRVARGWMRSYKASWTVFIHVYYSIMQKKMIQCMRLSQHCWLRLQYSVMWCHVGQSLLTDDSQEIITSIFRIVFLDWPEDAVSRTVWNATNYRPTNSFVYQITSIFGNFGWSLSPTLIRSIVTINLTANKGVTHLTHLTP